MPPADDTEHNNKRSKGRTHLLRFTIFGQTVILGFAWGLVGGILFQGVIALPDQVVRLIVEHPTVLTLVVTLISTALSIITSSFFTFAVKEALRYHLSGPITLFKLRTAIALSRPAWVLRWRYLKLSALTLAVYAMIEFLSSSWSTLLLPILVQWPIPLSGTELNMGSMAFVTKLSDDLYVNTTTSSQAPALETINVLTLLSGISAVNIQGGVQTSGIFSFNGVSYNRSTGGVLPAVDGYTGSSNVPLHGLEFSGGEVPTHYTADWGRNWRQSDTQGISKNYSVTQQGFTANVTCQAIDHSINSFTILPSATQASNASYTFLTWLAAVSCSGNVNSMTYYTLGNSSGQLDVGTLGFLPTVICPDTNSSSFNPYKFDVFMSGVGKYYLPTVVCEVAPYLTTVNVTYNGAIVSVDDVGTSSDLTSSPSLPLSQYIAAVMGYQAGSNQALTKNTIGDFLTAYGNNDTSLMYSELEDYWRGIAEFSGTQLRSGYSAAGQYIDDEIPSNMTISTSGTMYITTYGWESNHRTFFLLIVVITMIWGATVLAAAYSLMKETYSPIDPSFDFSDPVHLIVAASAGGLEGPLRNLEAEDREDMTVRFVDEVHDKGGKGFSRKLVIV